jgi:hypothetical protein
MQLYRWINAYPIILKNDEFAKGENEIVPIKQSDKLLNIYIYEI